MISFCVCLSNLLILMAIHRHEVEYPDLHVYEFASPFYSKWIVLTIKTFLSNI